MPSRLTDSIRAQHNCKQEKILIDVTVSRHFARCLAVLLPFSWDELADNTVPHIQAATQTSPAPRCV